MEDLTVEVKDKREGYIYIYDTYVETSIVITVNNRVEARGLQGRKDLRDCVQLLRR